MKHKTLVCLALAMMLIAACASAQQLPSVNCFSPGLLKVNGLENSAVSIDAALTVENAMYARNLSVLQAMLDGTNFRVQADGKTGTLSIARGGETLMQAAVTTDGQGARVSLDGTVYNVATPDEAAQDDTPTFMQNMPILERVPLTAIAAWLEALKAGDSVGFGVTAASAFDVQRTMSDDGERLTKLDISGGLSIGGETWQISGYLRQPGGKSPKDTFELTAKKDDANYLELSYSAARKDEIEQKNRKGKTSVATTIKSVGKLDGNAVHTVLKVNQKNEWTADGEKLNEKITVSVNMTHKDNTPGRRMQRLNQIDAEGKNVIRMTTTETDADAYTFTDEISGKIMMDGNTFLEGGAKLDVTVGGDAPEAVGAETTDMPLSQALEQAVQTLSRRIYQQLDEKTRKAISNGL